jgi:hypothetical protein
MQFEAACVLGVTEGGRDQLFGEGQVQGAGHQRVSAGFTSGVISVNDG